MASLTIVLFLIVSMAPSVASKLWYRHRSLGEVVAPSNMNLTVAVPEYCMLHCERANVCVALTYVPGGGSDAPGECLLYQKHVTSAETRVKFRSGAVYFSTHSPGVSNPRTDRDCFRVQTSNRDTCFHLIYSKITWDEARSVCQERGGDLAMLTSLEEGEAIRRKALSFGARGRYYIGLTDKEEEGEYRWLDGSAATFFNWNSTLPGVDSQGNDCAVIRADNGQWTECQCTNRRPFVCEYPLY